MRLCPWCGRRINGLPTCGYCEPYERLWQAYWNGEEDDHSRD